ncbi:hypothetical protein [Streptomyces sp. NPDC050988]
MTSLPNEVAIPQRSLEASGSYRPTTMLKELYESSELILMF